MTMVEEIRNWIALAAAILGGLIALKAFVMGQRQRRLENTLSLIEMFYKSRDPGDIDEWKRIFWASSEPSGAEPGHFVQVFDGETEQTPYEYLFSEGPPDNGAIGRMVEFFDFVAQQAMEKSIDLRVLYFELGQLMDSTHQWVLTIPFPGIAVPGEDSFLIYFYPNFAKLYARKMIDKKWMSRKHTHIE